MQYIYHAVVDILSNIESHIIKTLIYLKSILLIFSKSFGTFISQNIYSPLQKGTVLFINQLILFL